MTTHDTLASTDTGAKSAAEVEREVRQSRAKVERTLDQIQDRLSPGELVDQAVTYFRRSGGVEFARNLGESVKHNPMPVALVAVGLAWMMMSGRRPDDDNGYGRSAYWDDDLVGGEPQASPVYSSEYAALPGDAAESWHAGREPGHGGDDDDLGDTADRAWNTVRRAKEKADDLVDRGRRAASDAVEGATAGVESMTASARASMASARHGVRDARAQAARYGRRARQGVLETFYQQPLVLGALGVAVGAAIGAALPPTTTEDELLGDAGDRIKRDAEKTGREQLAKARATAEAAVAAGRAEADRQGLTTDDAKAAAGAVREKVERVAEAATEAATGQADKKGLGQGRDVTG